MENIDSRIIVYLALGIIACAWVATYSWFNPATRGRRLFATASYSACIWMLGDVIGRLSPTVESKFAGEIVRYFGVVNVPVWMFAFTRVYCGKTISSRAIGALLIIPAISLGMMATSQHHQWFFTSLEVASYGLRAEYGRYFWFVHLPYCYLLSALSVALVLNEMGRVPPQFRRQIFFLFISLCVPFAINILGITGFLGNDYDTALSFPIFAILLSVGIFRHRLLSVNPIAYESVFLNVHDGVIILSSDDTIMDINNTAARHTGKTRAQLIGTGFHKAFAEYRELTSRITDKREIADEFSHREDDTVSHYTVNTSNFIGIDSEYDGRIVTLRDITAQKKYQGSLETLAYVDPLTRLANRRRFQEETEKTLQRAARSNERFAVLYFDLNKFKEVNDTLGHGVGDELLKDIGVRAALALRAPDFVARLGGDEFVILLHNTTSADLPVVLARLIDHLEQPFTTGGHTLNPRISLGAACYPQDGDNLQALLRHADAEMYRVKGKSDFAGLPE